MLKKPGQEEAFLWFLQLQNATKYVFLGSKTTLLLLLFLLLFLYDYHV
jgi:hypothetical protein